MVVRPGNQPLGDRTVPFTMRKVLANPYLLLTLSSLFWAGNFVLSKAMATEIPPVTLAFGRWTLAFLFVLPFAGKHLRADRQQLLTHWKLLLLVSLLGITAFNTMIYIGLQSTTAINSLLLQSFFPVVIPALAFLFFREKLFARQIVGILVSLVGTLWLVSQGDVDRLLSASFNRGDGGVFVAIILYATYTLLRRFRPSVHPLSFLATTFGLGIIMLFPVWVGELLYQSLPELTLEVGLTLLYLAIFPSLVAYLFFNEAVGMIGATTAGLFSHLVPTFGSIMAIIFLGETFRSYHAWGILLIFAGIALSLLRRRRRSSVKA